jgi:hypothetical protein
MSTAGDPTESGTEDEMQDEGQETSLVQDVRNFNCKINFKKF